MEQRFNIVVLGGGTAGWITASLIAAEHNIKQNNKVSVTLIESPDIPTIGVGEGSWPSLKQTIQKIGISEVEFLSTCQASFKQGSKFINWLSDDETSHYYHPFVTPLGYVESDLHHNWQKNHLDSTFVDSVSIQGKLCDNHRAPKQLSTPEFAAVANYGYHLDAGKFAQLLLKHGTNNLGIHFIADHVMSVTSDDEDNIAFVTCKKSGKISADLYIDCTGADPLLLSKHYKIPLVTQKHVLFNDSALAVQIEREDLTEEINSATHSTAQSSGWIWDIGLQNRRGIGYTYSSAHIDDDSAKKELLDYLLKNTSVSNVHDIFIKKLSFTPGYREKFWHKNCVAVGMSAGFIEPLEASAIAMIELSASYISENLPTNKQHMHLVSQDYNDLFLYRWHRVIDFVKLHYVVSNKQNDKYWTDNKLLSSIPTRLQALLKLWKFRPPSRQDFFQMEEIFPSASYQFVLYGMGFNTQTLDYENNFNMNKKTDYFFQQTQKLTNKCLTGLPSNRELLTQLSMKYKNKINKTYFEIDDNE